MGKFVEYELMQKLSSLSPLGVVRPRNPQCKICRSTTYHFDVVDFNKYCSPRPYQFGVADIAVSYYRCSRCDFVFTDFMDGWSTDEMAQFIYNADYIKVDPEYASARPIRTAIAMAALFRGCEHLKILDYGSGSGEFARQLMARGFKYVESYDPFSSPNRPNGKFDLIFLFEVVEHVCHPLDTFADVVQMLKDDAAIVIGQTLQPPNIDEIRARWWYIAPRNGHISTYSDWTFLVISRVAGLLYRRGQGLYGFQKGFMEGPLGVALDRVGPTVELVQLFARDDKQWHGLENCDGRGFRWSSVQKLTWPGVVCVGGLAMVEIPFCMEIREGFAQDCKILIDGTVVPTRLRSEALVGEANVCAGSHTVQLVTPEPISPKALRGVPDERMLGLAVLAT